MTQGLRELTDSDWSVALESVLLPRLTGFLASRQAGHCMRVTDLDRDLMVRLAGPLRAAVPSATVVVLGDAALRVQAPELTVTSTKLVELRNPLPTGEQRPPLLVFVPNDLRVAAEDSFGVATFEHIPLEGVYSELAKRLIAELPPSLRAALESSLQVLRQGDAPWPYADDASVARFLLTGKLNDQEPEALGAALFELALVPDFRLLSRPENAPARIARNRQCVETITASTRTARVRALEVGLSDSPFRKQLGEFFATLDVSHPREWTRTIVRDRAYWPLAFHQWPFEDGGRSPEAIFIGDVELSDLPLVGPDTTDPRLTELIGHRVLPVSKTGPKKFSVTFRVDPPPARVQGLTRFVAEVLSRHQGPTGLRRRKSVWQGTKDSGAISFTSLGKVDWEEGWHSVRVYAETADGERIPLLDRQKQALRVGADAQELQPNESDVFYVLADEAVEIDPPQRAVPRDASVMHALFRARFSAVAQDRESANISITGCAWVDRNARSGVTHETLEVRLGKEGKAHVVISGLLAQLERALLSNPRQTRCLRLDIPLTGEPRISAFGDWPASEEAQTFIAARVAYFAAVAQNDLRLLLQVHLPDLTDSAQNYAAAYQAWLDALHLRAGTADAAMVSAALKELHCALTLDTVSIVLEDYQGVQREALLLGPTHPLRAAWHTAWSALGSLWLARCLQGPREFIVPTRDAILKQLAPSGFPPVLPFAEAPGRTALAVDNLTPFWSVYAAADEPDPRGLVGELCATFGLSEPSIGGSTIDGAYLTSRVVRYLLQHPYVRTLTVNAFNAGRAGALADVLLALQRQPEFADLHYDVKLFVPDPAAPGTGDALLGLLTPDSGAGAKEADAFSTPDSPLHPKLRLAIRSLQEFRDDPQAHAAHLTFLLDVFPAAAIRADVVREAEEASFVHGLVQPYAVAYREDEQSVTWLRRPLHHPAQPIEGAEALSDLLALVARTVSEATATVARGQYLPHARPVVGLSLSADERALLHQVHEVSDWVLTIDRNLGIEFFDHRRHATRPDYLIDHSPVAGSSSHRVAITSRSVTELRALLSPVLGDYGILGSDSHALVMLDQLRFLSGRMALKLLSSPTQRAEAVGLALSRLFLEHQGVFQNQIVVPLDAHLELYAILRRNAEELGDAVSFRRTDLALFDLDIQTRTLTCRLVEVKCYSAVGDLSAYVQLKNDVAEQISQSERVLQHHFDPLLHQVDRPDRAIKSQELSSLLEFYLDRAQRHGIILPDAAQEARYFLRHLDESYQLQFTRSAVIFDFRKPGTEQPQHENGIEFYRIGRDLIGQLLNSAAREAEGTRAPTATDAGDRTSVLTQELLDRRSLAPDVPTYATAAFLSPPRNRTLDWSESGPIPTPYPAGPSVPSGAPVREPSASAATGMPGAPRGGDLPVNSSPTPASPISTPSPDPASASDGILIPAPPTVRPLLPSVPNAGATSQPADSPLVPTAASGNGGPRATPPEREITASHPTPYDILLGATGITPQYGLLGEVAGRKVALDLNQTHTISLFGVQGGGKSYTLGSIAEMAALPIPGINHLPHPLATVIFHYSPTMDYKPEFTSMVSPNSVDEQIRILRENYGAEARALSDLVLLVPADKLAERQAEYPGIQVLPLKFAPSELKAAHWKFLMGAVGNQATYIRQVVRIMRTLRDDITLEGLRAAIAGSSLSDHLKELASTRIDLAAQYIDDTVSISEVVRPGRLIIVDLRDEFIEKDEALGLFVVLLQLFADARIDGHSFNKLVVFDEAHKFIDSPDLVAGLIEVVREMRHKGVSILVASQDPPSVPVSLIELSTQIILHKFNSPAWLKHIQKANAALGSVTPERMTQLKAGEAYIWSSKATDDTFTRGAVRLRCRPRVTQHGGATRLATPNDSP